MVTTEATVTTAAFSKKNLPIPILERKESYTHIHIDNHIVIQKQNIKNGSLQMNIKILFFIFFDSNNKDFL